MTTRCIIIVAAGIAAVVPMFVLGDIIGLNLFNTLAVVGLATVISPLVPERSVHSRQTPYGFGSTGWDTHRPEEPPRGFSGI